MAGMAFFNVAGYVLDRRKAQMACNYCFPTRKINVLNKFRILKERHVHMRKPYQSPGRMKNSSYYIVPVGD